MKSLQNNFNHSVWSLAVGWVAGVQVLLGLHHFTPTWAVMLASCLMDFGGCFHICKVVGVSGWPPPICAKLKKCVEVYLYSLMCHKSEVV